ncbi:MAG: molybdopterin-dependent oxidoreductase [Verrucomicrobia bacterium]|nr:molybdopterin-dependent oxidoreductase [Verrucomicrobiota bacterium]
MSTPHHPALATEMPRREFLRTSALAAATVLAAADSRAAEKKTAETKPAPKKKKELKVPEATTPFLTPSADFYNVERGNPLPYTLPIEKRREVGLERETWQLEIIADPDSNSKIERPKLKADGTALNFAALMKLAETKAVRFLKVITCNNLSDPLGMGLWEGVPLRDALWLAGPVENLRHVYYYGHHNEDPKQIFKCYLPMNRVFEEPPGYLPVILCYKLNGEWLTGERGGPVRMIVPEAYGFKSVKWLQRIVFTNNHQSDDTYANGNNDTNSWLKSFARFGRLPEQAKAGAPIPIYGHAQVGVSGVAKVQYWLRKEGEPLPKNDPYFATAPWRDAEISPLPDNWAGGLDTGALHPTQFDPATKRPREWPMRFTVCRWTATLRDVPAGKHELVCRTVDTAGYGQPLPRPFPKSGRNVLQKVSLDVRA